NGAGKKHSAHRQTPGTRAMRKRRLIRRQVQLTMDAGGAAKARSGGSVSTSVTISAWWPSVSTSWKTLAAEQKVESADGSATFDSTGDELRAVTGTPTLVEDDPACGHSKAKLSACVPASAMASAFQPRLGRADPRPAAKSNASRCRPPASGVNRLKR